MNDVVLKTPRQQAEINSWFYKFVKWVRSLFGLRRTLTSTVKSRYYNKDRSGALFTLHRNTPGAVQTWRIIYSGSSGALLITLDNLGDCRAYYRKQRREARKSGQQYQTSADERGAFLGVGEIHTHRFSFSWLSTGQKQKIRLLGVFDGDFAGFSKQYAMSLKTRAISTGDESLKLSLGNRAALKIGTAITFELLELKPLLGFTWEERIGRYDWQGLLLTYTHQIHKSPSFDPKIICRSK